MCPYLVDTHLPMKAHAYACHLTKLVTRSHRIHHRLRRKCRHAPPDGRAVAPAPPPPDFVDIIASAPLTNTWRPMSGFVSVADAFTISSPKRLAVAG